MEYTDGESLLQITSKHLPDYPALGSTILLTTFSGSALGLVANFCCVDSFYTIATVMADTKESSSHVEDADVQKKTIVRYEDDGTLSKDPGHLELVESTVEIRDFSDKEAKRILLKVDMRLLPILALFYLLAYLDRGNSTLYLAFEIERFATDKKEYSGQRRYRWHDR